MCLAKHDTLYHCSIQWLWTLQYITLLKWGCQLLGLFFSFNITFLWLQHACWMFTACQFVFSYITKRRTMFTILKFSHQHVHMLNKTSRFKTKLIGNNAEASRVNCNTLWCLSLTFSHSRQQTSLLQITAQPILGRGASTLCYVLVNIK